MKGLTLQKGCTPRVVIWTVSKLDRIPFRLPSSPRRRRVDLVGVYVTRYYQRTYPTTTTTPSSGRVRRLLGNVSHRRLTPVTFAEGNDHHATKRSSAAATRITFRRVRITRLRHAFKRPSEAAIVGNVWPIQITSVTSITEAGT